MNSHRPFRKFITLQNKIVALEKSNPRFKRILSEYQSMTEDLYLLENNESENVTDDFLNSVQLQTEYLEEEIDDWLLNSTENEL